MKNKLNLKLYMAAAVRFCVALIAVPLLVLFATLGMELPSWLMATLIISLGIFACLAASAPFRFLLANAKQVFTESVAAQVVFSVGAVFFWLLLWTLTKSLPKQQPIGLFIPVLFLSLFGFAWLNVSIVLVMLNAAGFILAVGRKLSRLARCGWYVLVTLLPIAGILLFLYGPEAMDSSKLSFAVVALAIAVYLGIQDFLHHPPISSPSRYDPAASIVARLFGQRAK